MTRAAILARVSTAGRCETCHEWNVSGPVCADCMGWFDVGTLDYEIARLRGRLVALARQMEAERRDAAWNKTMARLKAGLNARIEQAADDLSNRLDRLGQP